MWHVRTMTSVFLWHYLVKLYEVEGVRLVCEVNHHAALFQSLLHQLVIVMLRWKFEFEICVLRFQRSGKMTTRYVLMKNACTMFLTDYREAMET